MTWILFSGKRGSWLHQCKRFYSWQITIIRRPEMLLWELRTNIRITICFAVWLMVEFLRSLISFFLTTADDGYLVK